MLMHLSGAHGPFSTRNVVIITDSDGCTGLGEVPCGEKIRRTIEEASALINGKPAARYRSLLREVAAEFADRDACDRGLQTFDLRTTVHAVIAVESALLDLHGQFLRVPVAELLGAKQQCTSVPMLGYLFFVGDYKAHTQSLNMLPVLNPIASLVIHSSIADIETVLVAGKPVHRGGRLVADLTEVRRMAEESLDYLYWNAGRDPPQRAECLSRGTVTATSSSATDRSFDGGVAVERRHRHNAEFYAPTLRLRDVLQRVDDQTIRPLTNHTTPC